MSLLWRFCCSRIRKPSRQAAAFLLLHSVFCGAVGLVLWLILCSRTLGSWEWAVVWAGFLAYFLGFLGGTVYLYRVT